MKTQTQIPIVRRTLGFPLFLTGLALLPLIASAVTLNVRPTGGAGFYSTIQAAVNAANPGDTVQIYSGTYREMVTLPRGGTSNTQRITITNAPGAVVKIKGSEVVTGTWTKYGSSTGNGWSKVINNTFFGTDSNPYNIDHEDFSLPAPVKFSIGQVFGNETIMLRQVNHDINTPSNPNAAINLVDTKPNTWYARTNNANGTTTVYVNFNGTDPNDQNFTVELAVRPSCIRANMAPNVLGNPVQGDVDFVTIQGLTCIHTANQPAGAYPLKPENRNRNAFATIEPRSGSDWIITKNFIGYCVGAAVNVGNLLWLNGAAQDDTIESGNILVQDNEFAGCQYSAIYNWFNNNSMRIMGNYFHDNIGRSYPGGSVGRHPGLINGHMTTNSLISGNFFYRNMESWPDAGWQGVIIRGNLFIEDPGWHWEIDHGPVWFVNNIYINSTITHQAHTTKYYHNLFVNTSISDDARSDEPVAVKDPQTNQNITLPLPRYPLSYHDNRRFNNIYMGNTTQIFPCKSLPVSNNNVYYNAIAPTGEGSSSVSRTGYTTGFTYSVNTATKTATITFIPDSALASAHTPTIITNATIGTTPLPDPSPVASHMYSDAATKVGLSSNDIDRDYFGNSWTNSTMKVGPFRNTTNGVANTFTVWPKP